MVSGTGLGSRIALCVRVPRSGILEGVRIGLSTCTAPQDVRVAFQDIAAATNLPDNVEDQYRVEPASKFVTNAIFESGLITSDGTDGGGRRTVTAGEMLAVTMRWDGASGTLITPALYDVNASPQLYCHPNYTTRWGGSGNWFGSEINPPCLDLVYEGGIVESTGWLSAFASVLQNAHTPASSPDEYALYFIPKFTGTVNRLGAWWNLLSTSVDVEWTIYDAAGNVMERLAQPNNEQGFTGRVPCWSPYFGDVLLQRGLEYRISVRPTTAANLYAPTSSLTAGKRLAHPFGPVGCLSTRTDNGAWTNDVTKMPYYLIGYSALDR